MPAGISADGSSTLSTSSTSFAILIPVLSPCGGLTATNATAVGTDSHRPVPHTGPLLFFTSQRVAGVATLGNESFGGGEKAPEEKKFYFK